MANSTWLPGTIMCFDWLDFQTSFSHLPYDFIFLLIVTMFLEVLDPPPPPKNAATSNKQCNMRFL
jgi:hypothetical protein